MYNTAQMKTDSTKRFTIQDTVKRSSTEEKNDSDVTSERI